MNIYLVIIGMALIVLFTLMGNNPLDEMREARKNDKRDPLIRAIQEHNEGNGIKGWGTSGSQGRASLGNPYYGQSASPNNYAPQRGYGQGTYGQNPYDQQAFPSYMQNQGANPYAPGQPATPAQPENSYYPPPPENPYNIPGSPQIQPNTPQSLYPPLAPQSMLKHTLGTGVQVSFAGIYVYTTDANGKQVLMPDGVYPVHNSQLKITVKNGKNIVYNQ